jgi:hypothetical protein
MLRRSHPLAGAVIGAAAAALVAASPALACSASTGRPITSFGGGDGTINVPWYTGGIGRGDTFLGQPLVHLDVTPSGQPGVGSFRTVSIAHVQDGGTGDDIGSLVVRGYRSDGTPDPAYAGGKALVIPSFTSTGIDDSYAGAGSDSQRRLVVGQLRSDIGSPPSIRLLRITAAGAIDKAYGAPVVAGGTTAAGIDGAEAAFAVRSSGWVWGCGWGALQPDRVRLTEIDPQGRVHSQRWVDLPVGTGGSAARACTSIAAATDGSALVAVSRSFGDGTTAGLLKIRRDGTVDTSFGAGGYASWTGGAARVVTTAQDGSYLVGTASRTDSTWTNQVVHVLAGGALDPGWGTDGVADVCHSDVELATVSPGSGGAAYVGLTSATPAGKPGVLRLSPDGELDASYARCGWLEIPSGGGEGTGPAGVVEVRSGVTLIGVTAPRAPSTAGTVPGSRVDKRTA